MSRKKENLNEIISKEFKRLRYDKIRELQFNGFITCGYLRDMYIHKTEEYRVIGWCALTKQWCNTPFEKEENCEYYKRYFKNEFRKDIK